MYQFSVIGFFEISQTQSEPWDSSYMANEIPATFVCMIYQIRKLFLNYNSIKDQIELIAINLNYSLLTAMPLSKTS